MNQELRQRLLDLQQADQDTRTRLVEEGKLFQGYAEEMAAVHEHNAQQLQHIMDEVGWPGQSLVGEDGEKAAFLIAHHAIGLPAFQRHCLTLIQQAVKQGDLPRHREAYFTDRIRFNQRQPQVYGTIFDWDEHGEMSPWPIEESEAVESRRKEMGLPPLARSIQEMRTQAHAEGNVSPPLPYHDRQQQIETWAKKVGWIED